ncbi:MAG: hypothetical protein AAF806_05825 [Bacteroidota bacterium]
MVSYRSFFAILLGVSFLVLLLILLQQHIPSLAEFTSISWISALVFTLVNITMYFIGRRSATNRNKGQFISIFMGFTLLKMLFAVCIILLYVQYYNPSTKFFVFPFFLLYLVYTVFELWFMMKLGRAESDSVRD